MAPTLLDNSLCEMTEEKLSATVWCHCVKLSLLAVMLWLSADAYSECHMGIVKKSVSVTSWFCFEVPLDVIQRFTIEAD